MLFVESKTLRYTLNGPQRIQLLNALQAKNLIPVIRSARLNCFDHTLLGVERVAEMEAAVATQTESENGEPYIPGDFFCQNDYVLFLVFDEHKEDSQLIHAGIVYDLLTPEPFRKLDTFCHDLRESLLAQGEPQSSHAGGVLPQWEQGKPIIPEGFKRFVARQDTDSLYTSLRKESMSTRVLAASKLEDENARLFLRRAREAHLEGYAAKLLSGETSDSHGFSLQRLEDAGLVEREVQVSCRKTGHALFRLPNAHALAVVTVSDATCSECGAAVADERVEEVIAPTQLASSLLEDGSWLVSRLYNILRELGVPESEIAVGPSEGEGHGQMMANICGESFLLVARDGDLTPAFARWAIDLEVETEASHLVAVATGRVHNQARMLLLNHARRRQSAGRDFELVLADDAQTASRELRDAFARVSGRIVAEQVCKLDSSLGLSVSHLITTKFLLLRETEDYVRERPSTSGAPDFFHERGPLALAAQASGGGGETVGGDANVSDAPDAATIEFESPTPPPNHDTSGSWE